MLMTWIEMMVPLAFLLATVLAWGLHPRVCVAEGRFITGRRALRQRRLRERWGEAYGRGSFSEGL
ncbi:MAG: hypothetical protein EPN23_01130 [Verrucomicrobia bacterium]|nr:MAG: hypothetical protein EPN23_01130 [Verrucomicrobiota bacterium]